MINDPYYSLEEAAALIGVSPATLRQRLNNRRYDGYKPARKWLMRESQIEAAMRLEQTSAHREPEPSPAGLSPHSRLRKRIQRQAS